MSFGKLKMMEKGRKFYINLLTNKNNNNKISINIGIMLKKNEDIKEEEKYQNICEELAKEKRNLEITKTRIAYYSLD
jgi:superfamily II RNA helicase